MASHTNPGAQPPAEEHTAGGVAGNTLAVAPLSPATVAGTVQRLQRTAGNAAVNRLLARQPTAPAPPADPATPAAAPSPAEAAVQAILGVNTRDKVLSACLAAGKQWPAAVTAFGATHDPAPTLQAAMVRSLGIEDAARAYAYLQFGTLRLADKLFIAGIGSGTDEETIWRLLPSVRTSFSTVEAEFKDSYSVQGPNTFGAHYTDTGKLLDGTDSLLAGFISSEFDGSDFAKSMALLTYGEVRPVDDLHIAMESVHLLAASVLAALDKVARTSGPAAKGTVEKLYRDSYKRELRTRLEGELGPSSDDFKKAKLILEGAWTPKARIKLACEGLGTDEDAIWAALGDATDPELTALRDEWNQPGGELKPLIVDELGGADFERFKAVMEGANTMKGRLAQFGVAVKDNQQMVIVAALEHPEIEQAFRTEWAQPTSAFRKEFTGEERIGAALMWGSHLVSDEPLVRLRLAVDLASNKGVHRVLIENVTTDPLRAKVMADPQLPGLLKAMDDWLRFETLLMPRDDLKARAAWLAQKFEREKGVWGSSSAGLAYGDEQRELDAALKNAKDPNNLTPDERKVVGQRAAATEASLDDFIKARDEFDQLAIQVVGAAAGLLATLMTGGAAGPMTAALLARVALTQACASAAAVWAIKQERTTAGEAARAFAVGAASGVAQSMATGPVVKLLAGPGGKALEAESVNVASKVAGEQFQGVGYNVLKGTLESAAGGAAGSFVDSASRADTWRGGFVVGLEKLIVDVATGAATSGAMGGAIEGLKAGLFSGTVKAPTPSSGPPAAPVPTKLEPIHVARAKVMLQSGGEALTWDYWVKTLADFGEHAAIAKQAFAAARQEMLEAAVARLEAELKALGVKAVVPAGGAFEVPLELVVVPEGATDPAAVQRALARLREELGAGFEASTGVRTRAGLAGEAVGGVKGTATYERGTAAMTPAQFAERVNADVVAGGTEWMVRGTQATFGGLAGDIATVTLVVPPGTQVTVRLQVVEAGNLPLGAHGGQAGPGRITLAQGPGGTWEATVHIDAMLHPSNVRSVVGHELDEIAGLVNRSATSPTGPLTPEQLTAQMRAGIFTRNPEFGAQPTVHDHAMAAELFDMWQRWRGLAPNSPERAMLERQIVAHADEMALNDPHNANQKGYLLHEHGNRSRPWKDVVDAANTIGGAAFAHDSMVGAGQLRAGSFITPEVVAHIMFGAPQATLANFERAGIGGCHQDAQLLDFVNSSNLGVAVVADGVRNVGGNTYTRYRQYMWNDPNTPAPRRGAANYPVDPNVPPPGWTRARPPKTTATDLGAFLKEVDDFLEARGGPLPVTETIDGTTAGGVPFRAYVNNGQVATVFPFPGNTF